MNKILLTSALTILSASAVNAQTMPEANAGKGKVMCYGIAKAGQNDCHSADGVNSCGGSSKRDFDKNDWMFATAEECASKGGSTTKPEKSN
jgi:uncharacterized membrane protein